MKATKIFVSFNPGVEVEKSTALRLQTISSLYNAIVYLPDRVGADSMKPSTKERILDSDVFVMFSTEELSEQVKEEALLALNSGKKSVIFYDTLKGKNLEVSGSMKHLLTEIFFDSRKDTAVDIMTKVKERGFIANSKKPSDSDRSASALIGIGIGLALLWAFSDDGNKKKKNRNR